MFEENRDIGTISFDFLEKGEPMNYAVNLARKMPLFETPEDVNQLIRHSYIADVYKPELLSQIVEVLADPARALIILASKSFADDTLPIHEKWYKFNYCLEKHSEERLAQLKNAQVTENGKQLDLPP